MLKINCSKLILLSFLLFYFSDSHADNESRYYKNISMVSLIANPDKFIDKNIRFIGFLGDQYADRYISIYLHSDDAKLKNIPNSLFLKSKKYFDYSKYCKNIYVQVSGKLKYNGSFYYVELLKNIRPFDRENYKKLNKTCEPTSNQVEAG